MWRACLVMVVAVLGADAAAWGDLRQMATELTGSAVADRSACTATAGRNAEYLAREFARLNAGTSAGGQVFRQGFLMTVPVLEKCVAREVGGGGGEELKMWPLMPMGGQAAAVGGGKKRMAVLYGGRGTLEELKGKEVAGRLVALELGSEALAWQRCASLGAAGILFLDEAGKPAGNGDFLDKATAIPLGLPRFYTDDEDTEEQVRGGAVKEVEVEVKVTWEERQAENVLWLIPAKTPGQGGAGLGPMEERWAQQLVVLQARYDGVSEVMGRAPGATQAMNAAVLVELGEAVARAREHGSVLVLATAGDAWNDAGTRAFLEMLGPEMRERGRAMAALRERVAEARGRLAEARAAVAGLSAAAGGGPVVGASAARAVEQALLGEAARVEEELQRARLAGNEGEVARWRGEKREILGAINRVMGHGGPAGSPTSGAEWARVSAAAKAAGVIWQREVARCETELEAVGTWPEIREVIGGREPLLMLSLALTGSAESARYGLFFRSAYDPVLDVTARMAPFAQAIRRYAAAEAGDGEGAAFDVLSLENRFTLETFFPVALGFSSDAAVARGMPGGALATVADRAEFLDTPHDMVERIDWDHVAVQVQSIEGLLLGRGGPGVAPTGGALTDPQFYGRADLPVQVADQPVTLYERAAGETLPQLRAAGALLGGEAVVEGAAGEPLGPVLAGTRRMDWHLTHADGTAVFTAVLRSERLRVRMQAFEFGADGVPMRALVGNESELQGEAADFSPDPGRPVRAMVFACRRLDAFGLFDPRYLDCLDQLEVLDARRGDAAGLTNVYTDGRRDAAGMAAVFMEPDVRWQILGARGNVRNRMVLINADAAAPNGRGFDTTDPARIGPLNWRTAQDLVALDTRRKGDLERFGISNEVIRGLQAESERTLGAGRAGWEKRDYPGLFAAADATWSLQSQEYGDLIETSNGIIRGVIFLLLGVIPFSYFLERLVIGAVNVYRQIGWFFGIFAVMTAGLWFHPAFRISSAPLMILLAFLILILSGIVVTILWGKFEEELARLRGTDGTALHMTSFRRGAVVGAAVRLGLSNMRRRGMRTGLTLATLVLLTFTLLCFTSVRATVEVTPTALSWPAAQGAGVPPAGILIRQSGWGELPPATVELARGLALPATEGGPAGPVAERWWYASERAEQAWLLPVRRVAESIPATTRGAAATQSVATQSATAQGMASSVEGASVYPVMGLLGLERSEAAFQGAGVAEVLAGLGEMGDDRCWLPEKARDALGVKAGDKVGMVGYTLTVAGFFDAAGFGRLRALTGDPLSPVDPASTVTGGGGGGSGQGTDVRRMESGYRYLDAFSVAVVPARVVQRLGGRLSSVMVRPAEIDARPEQGGAALLRNVAEGLARRSAFAVYVSDGRQVAAINAAEATRPRDLGAVVVPLLIAGVIVLNTMLSAVSERTREIHVYTSVGLAPAHVGMLFLAEAAALGTLGVVFGYIFGQGTATVLSWTHLMPGVDLNYSSMGAILTMGLVLGLVMASALWPAWSASRLASPSLQRDWKLPHPVGDVLAVDLPFTVNETAARGVCAFVAEYLETATGTGRFTADDVAGFAERQTLGMMRGIRARIWLAPYDMGVIQTMRLSIHPTEQGHAFEVHVELMREAGNPAAWRRLNRPFLVEIRKQFLLWRAVDAGRMREYVEKSEKLFKMTNDE